MENSREEIWKDVVGYEGIYSVSNYGRIRRDLNGTGSNRARAGKILQPSFVCGYPVVSLCHLGTQVNKKIHRLVAEAFLGECPPDRQQVNHKDGVKTNNHVDNLEYVSCGENIRHAHAIGLCNPVSGDNHYFKKHPEKILRGDRHHMHLHPEYRSRGDKHGLTKIKDAEIVELFILQAAGWSQKQIAGRYNSHVMTINKILRGKRRMNFDLI